MPAAQILQRNIRPRRQIDEVEEISSASDGEEDVPNGMRDEPHNDSDSERQSGDEEHESADYHTASDMSEDSEDGGEDVEQKIGSVSFGALKQAQDTISRKRKRGSDETADNDQKLAALRARLEKIREEKSRSEATRGEHDHKKAKKSTTNQPQGFFAGDDEEDQDSSEDDNSDSDSAPSEEGAPQHARSSKHAPTTQSSKRQVTRKRTVIDVPKRVIRDPRFDSLGRSSNHNDNSEKAYEFIRDYQKSEIAELQSAIKQTRNDDEKEILRKKMVSMQNRLKSKEEMERQQAIIRKHRKEEREKVAQGKTPFYLKKKDVKEAALVEKFKGMKGKDREKLMDRRRKKESQKEKKRMPMARR